MPSKRRSGRIAKELAILLLGTDTAGKVFAEETKTVVLSRHGAGVVSRYRFAPDEVLTLRLAGSPKEAEVRLVGQIGGEPGRYIHGLAFVDPDLDFWPMEFPPPEPFGPAQPKLTLECTSCHSQQAVAPSEIEEDVYSVNGNVLRFCHSCGTSTPWTKARAEAAPAEPGKTSQSQRAAAGSPDRHHVPRPAPSNGDSLFRNAVSVATSAEAFAHSSHSAPGAPGPTRAPAPESTGASMPSSAYSAAALETIPTAAAEPPGLAVNERREAVPDPSPAASTEPPHRPTAPRGRPVNRRKHLRVRVNFSACIKEPLGALDIVECANMSKGGLCFHSRKHYPVGSTIEIAVPFSPGAPALFVPAKIKRVEPLGDGPFFRYGVMYIDPKS
jgi:hypothetical protein